MRPIALGLAVLISGSALDAGTIAGQTSDAVTFQPTSSAGRAARTGEGFLAGSSLSARLITALAGGAVGAGLGFFASQVLTSDWDADPDDKGVDRRPWAAVGGSIGFAVGFSFPLTGRRASSRPVRSAPAGRPTITAEELDGTGASTAYETVELLRPEWLTARGFHSIGEDADQRILAYVDDIRLGAVEALTEVNAQDVHSIHFLDPAASTYRWGAGHSHGAILVLTKAAGPSGDVRVRRPGGRE